MTDSIPPVRSFSESRGYRWEAVERLEYKAEGTHFKDITRQVLFGADSGLPTELRYFEVSVGGHSTFERHEHVHAVMILRGNGEVLVGDTVYPVQAFDLVHVPPLTWHQFHASAEAPLGFLCLVTCERDRPQRPSSADVEQLKQHPVISAFMRL